MAVRVLNFQTAQRAEVLWFYRENREKRNGSENQVFEQDMAGKHTMVILLMI